MKKIVVIMLASAFAVIGGSHADARIVPTPELCAEADTAPPECDQVVDGVYPPAILPPTTPPTTVPPTTAPPTTVPPTTAPPTTSPPTDPPTTTTPSVAVAPPAPPATPGTLASTGSSGITGILQLGALLITGGALVLIAARRRSTADAAAT